MKENPLFHQPSGGGGFLSKSESAPLEKGFFSHGVGDLFGVSSETGRGGCLLRKNMQSAKASQIHSYDFTQTDKFSHDQWKILNRMAGQFADNLAPRLTPLLQSRVIVEFWEIRSLTFQEYLDFLPTPTPMAIFQLEEEQKNQTSSKGMWVVDTLLACMLVERLMGGRGEPIEEIRELSNIEQAVLRKNLFAKVIETMMEAWKEIGGMRPRLEGVEFEPQQVILVPYNELMVIFAYRMKVGIVEGVWELAVPFRFLKQNLSHKSFEEYLSKSASPKISEQIPSSLFSKKIEVGKLPIGVEIGRAEIPFQDLLNLEAGDIIRLDSILGSALRIMVSGRIKFLGKPGLRDNKYAVQITSVVDEGDDNNEE